MGGLQQLEYEEVVYRLQRANAQNTERRPEDRCSWQRRPVDVFCNPAILLASVMVIFDVRWCGVECTNHCRH
jgi:hypothetical protein